MIFFVLVCCSFCLKYIEASIVARVLWEEAEERIIGSVLARTKKPVINMEQRTSSQLFSHFEKYTALRSCINITAEVLVGACGNTHWHKMHSEALNADSMSLFTAMHIVCDGYCHQVYSLFCNI